MVMKTDNLIGNDGISPFQTLDNLWNKQGAVRTTDLSFPTICIWLS